MNRGYSSGGTADAALNADEENKDDLNVDLYAVGQSYLTLYNVNYVYRLKTHAVYEQGRVQIFDVFIVQQDAKLAEFYLFNNIWKETLILS